MVNWRDQGDVPLSTYVEEFTRVGSPLLAEAAAIHAAAGEHSALALAMMWVEQKYGTYTDIIPFAFRNPLSLAKPDGGVGRDRWMQFRSYAEGVTAWKARVTSQTYKDGIYAKTTTLAELIRDAYAPASENNVNLYIDTVQALLQKWPRMPKEQGMPCLDGAVARA